MSNTTITVGELDDLFAQDADIQYWTNGCRTPRRNLWEDQIILYVVPERTRYGTVRLIVYVGERRSIIEYNQNKTNQRSPNG